MALHPNFPESPYATLDPALRRFPADEALRESSMEKLMPSLAIEIDRANEKKDADVQYGFVYVDEESFEKYKPASFRQLVDSFM